MARPHKRQAVGGSVVTGHQKLQLGGWMSTVGGSPWRWPFPTNLALVLRTYQSPAAMGLLADGSGLVGLGRGSWPHQLRRAPNRSDLLPDKAGISLCVCVCASVCVCGFGMAGWWEGQAKSFDH